MTPDSPLQWHHISLTQQTSDRCDQGLGKWLAVLYYRTWGQHFLSRSKVLRKTLAYITCAIRQTYIYHPAKGARSSCQKVAKILRARIVLTLLLVTRSISAGSGVSAGNVRCGESWSERPAHKAHTAHLFMLFMSCIPLPIVSIHSPAQLSPNIGLGMSCTLWLWPHSNSNQLS